MTKTERWYALVEELRAVSPRPRSAQWLANRYEVSRRTIERDLDGLLQAGVPLYALPGRAGGWVLDATASLGTPALDPAEIIALAVGARLLAGTPFAADARLAMQKLCGTLGEGGRRDAYAAAARIGMVREPAPESVPRVLQRALRDRKVLRLEYAAADGEVTVREVEPLGFIGSGQWYLVGWCRLRGAVRGFRLDRIKAVEPLAETAPIREVDLAGVATGHRVDPMSELTPVAWPEMPAANSDNTLSPKW